MTNRNGRFENVLLKLWRELPHDLTIGHKKSRQSIQTLKRHSIPLGVPAAVAGGSFAIPEFAARDYACGHWAWAVPNEEAIAMLVRHSPIVEIGAGTGYWARLAAQAGADIVAYDSRVGQKGRRTRRGTCWVAKCGAYFPVRRGGSYMVRYHRRRTLFLCWPPYKSRMAEKALAGYQGRKVIYIGENGGCTASDEFHAMLEREWEMVDVIRIPQWHGIHDRMEVYQRMAVQGR
jgi:hypothetical protein